MPPSSLRSSYLIRFHEMPQIPKYLRPESQDLLWTFSAFCHSGNFLNEELAARSFHFPIKGLNCGFGICFEFRNSDFVFPDPPLDSD